MSEPQNSSTLVHLEGTTVDKILPEKEFIKRIIEVTRLSACNRILCNAFIHIFKTEVIKTLGENQIVDNTEDLIEQEKNRYNKRYNYLLKKIKNKTNYTYNIYPIETKSLFSGLDIVWNRKYSNRLKITKSINLDKNIHDGFYTVNSTEEPPITIFENDRFIVDVRHSSGIIISPYIPLYTVSIEFAATHNKTFRYRFMNKMYQWKRSVIKILINIKENWLFNKLKETFNNEERRKTRTARKKGED